MRASGLTLSIHESARPPEEARAIADEVFMRREGSARRGLGSRRWLAGATECAGLDGGAKVRGWVARPEQRDRALAHHVRPVALDGGVLLCVVTGQRQQGPGPV